MTSWKSGSWNPVGRGILKSIGSLAFLTPISELSSDVNLRLNVEEALVALDFPAYALDSVLALEIDFVF